MNIDASKKQTSSPRAGRGALAALLLTGAAVLASCSNFDLTHVDNTVELMNYSPTRPASQAASAPAGSQPASAPVSPLATMPASQPVAIGVRDAIYMTLQNNKELILQKFNPQIVRTNEDIQAAVFDPTVGALVTQARNRGKNSVDAPLNTSNTTIASLNAQQQFVTGTTVNLNASTNYNHPVDSLYDDFAATRLGMTVTQSLLQGAGVDVNLASLRQAKIDTQVSEYELRGFAETLVASVESVYWDYILAQRQIDIVVQALDLARQQAAETRERIKVGKLAPTEEAAADSEVALREENLINARSLLVQTRLKLLKLLNPPGANIWHRDVIVTDPPVIPDGKLDDVENHVKVALKYRPDLNQALLAVERGELEIVKTKNGLLPKLDAFITLGRTGYSETFGRSLHGLDDQGYDALAGLSFSFPPANRDAIARNQKAVLSKDQAREAVLNLENTIQVDVRSAYEEVVRTRQQVEATRVTRHLQEVKLQAETEKFRVGKSTSILVATAQRDLLQSQITEVNAQTNLLQAYITLYRLEGSLLERRHIMAPGRTQVKALWFRPQQ